MKYLDNVRDPRAAQDLLGRIRETATRPWSLMEAAGGQAQQFLRFGIDRALPAGLEVRHGPGCPVCATPTETIDRAIAIAARPGRIFCTSGDLLHVPGTHRCLADLGGSDGEVRVVYSPLDALALARKHPERSVVFFAVGFETTAPAAAAAVREADRLGLENFALLTAHRRAARVLGAALDGTGTKIHALLAAGHAAAVTGLTDYEELAARRRVPIVVIGSEPVDLLEGILRAVRRLEEGTWGVENQYARAVRPDGNAQARASIAAVFEPADADWRGFGRIPGSALALRPEFQRFDALTRDPEPRRAATRESTGCPCGAVVTGRLEPPECPAFATGCNPDRPLGAPMVAAEGVCAAYYRYRRVRADAPAVPAPLTIVATPAPQGQA